MQDFGVYVQLGLFVQSRQRYLDMSARAQSIRESDLDAEGYGLTTGEAGTNSASNTWATTHMTKTAAMASQYLVLRLTNRLG